MKKLLLGVLMLSAFGTYAQTKKVILHDYTGVKCQFCTDGTVRIEQMLAADPVSFIPVQIHTGSYTPAGSPLKTAEGDAINTFAKPYGYPAGSVDMTAYPPAQDANWTGLAMNRGAWSAAYGVQVAKTALASVGIYNRKKLTDTTFEADVNVMFTTAPNGTDPITVNVFVLEDKIKAEKVGTAAATNFEQTNYSGGPHGGASPLTWKDHQYVHNNVLRQVLGSTWGFTGIVPNVPVLNQVYTKKITFTIPSTSDVANTRLVAFVSYNGALNKSVLNGEMLSVGKTFFPVGIEETVKNLEILSAYPNPAKAGDVVNVEFETTQSGLVTMNVYNSVGQLVATPYSSNDVKGGHFIQWKTGLDNLAAGTYIIEVATADGAQTQKITLQ